MGRTKQEQRMRKFLFGVGILSTILIAILLIGIGYTVYVGSGQEAEGKQFADNAIIAITSHWNVQELRSRGSDKFLKNVKPEDLVSLFVFFGSLGPLVDYQGSRLEAWNVSVATQNGNVINAVYRAQARYQHGQANIECDLIKMHDAWRIDGFGVNSPNLLENRIGRSM
jgi:hypothetical protein